MEIIGDVLGGLIVFTIVFFVLDFSRGGPAR